MSVPIMVVGAGGHARVLVALIDQIAGWRVAGVLDRHSQSLGEPVGSTTISGTFADLTSLASRGICHVAVAIGDNRERLSVFAAAREAGLSIPVLLHPRAWVEPTVRLGEGTVVCASATIGAQVEIGLNCIVNTGSIVDHESQLGAGAHVAPGVRIAGRVVVGEGAMVGIGSTVRERIRIGAFAVIGAGSVVVDDVPDGATAYGCPARVVMQK
jgi:sugar O-acyltransferase (sialic acid O-acetyltransferase NeuD family)